MISAGPTCPVERLGQPCSPRPVSAEVDAHARDGRTVTTTHSDPDGDYRLTLAAGQYTLVVVTSNGFPRCPSTALTVTDGPPARADVSCDTGIR
jgi:Carboxypeptidase regulatory-like domain